MTRLSEIKRIASQVADYWGYESYCDFLCDFQLLTFGEMLETASEEDGIRINWGSFTESDLLVKL